MKQIYIFGKYLLSKRDLKITKMAVAEEVVGNCDAVNNYRGLLSRLLSDTDTDIYRFTRSLRRHGEAGRKEREKIRRGTK